ncbi:MAG: CHRD domain-containing protein [Desulfobacterales bacterium]
MDKHSAVFRNLISIIVAFGLFAGVTYAGEALCFQCAIASEEHTAAEGAVSIMENGSTLTYRIVVHHLEDITMAHLHLGKAGDIGSPVVWLYPPGPPPRLIPGKFEGVLAEGTITRDDLIGPMRGRPLESLIAEMRKGNVFLNIHTKTHAQGEFCGLVPIAK